MFIKRNKNRVGATAEINTSVPQVIEIEQDNGPKTHRKFSFAETYRRKSFYNKEKSQIPTYMQAKQRQKDIRYFHRRNFYKKQKNLEQIFKQNCRIYVQINKQKSYYHSLMKNFKKSHSVSVACQKDRESVENKFQWNSRGLSIDNQTFLFDKKNYSSSTTCKNMDKKPKDFAKNTPNIVRNRCEKNKTQISHCKNSKKEKENCYDFVQFGQNKKKKQEIQFQKDKPLAIKMRKRPSTGFRF